MILSSLKVSQNLNPALTSAASPVVAALERLGFRAEGGQFTRGEIRFRQSGRWAVLEQSCAVGEAVFDFGRPGLWRTLNVARRVFELPDTVLALADQDSFGDDEQENPFAACLAWALATADGETPPGWQPEPRAFVDSLVPKNRLTIQTGGAIRQGELIHTSQRLALRVPIVPTLPPTLSAPRRTQLRAVLRDAQNTWSLVRLGLTAAPELPAVLAEIDLTGVPAAALEPLLSASLETLRFVVARLVETAEILAEATVASAALDSAAFPQPSTQGSTT